MKREAPKALRCAIYTRVSTEYGLEQEFNSLDNQREAAEAYIKSQAHEGWRALPARYDDGGFSVREAGKVRSDQFFGGIDGEPEAVAEIKRGGPYRASISLASPVFGYGMGQHAADWLEGKSIPQAMDILPRALTLTNIAQYEADLANPSQVYADQTRRDVYLKMYGNICYDTRDRYLNFPWSSERG